MPENPWTIVHYNHHNGIRVYWNEWIYTFFYDKDFGEWVITYESCFLHMSKDSTQLPYVSAPWR